MKAEISVNINAYDISRKAHQHHEIDLKAQRPLPKHFQYTGGSENTENGVPDFSMIIQDETSTNDVPVPRNYVTLIHIPQQHASGESHTCQLLANRFTERIYVSPKSSIPQKSCSSFCQYAGGPSRFKETMDASRSTQVPVRFRESYIVHRDNTRRRYRMALECQPKIRPRAFSETLWVRPKRAEVGFVSRVDYGQQAPTQYKATVHLLPRSFCSNLIEDFDFLDDSDVSWTEVSDDEEEEFEDFDSRAASADSVLIGVVDQTNGVKEFQAVKTPQNRYEIEFGRSTLID